MIAYKLFRRRRDGTLGPLFINTRQVIPLREWLAAEEHETKGFAFRPGWHCTKSPVAPHLYPRRDRVWYRVEIEGTTEMKRPESQGGTWYLANRMRVIERVRQREMNHEPV